MGEVKIVWAAPPSAGPTSTGGGSETLINYLSQALLTTPVKPGGRQLALTIFILRVVSSRAIIKREKPPPLEGGGWGPDQLGQLALTYWMPQSDYNLDSYWAVKTSQGAHLRLYRYLYMYMYIYIYI